jgi:Rhodopirellula transposase DDE domain
VNSVNEQAQNSILTPNQVDDLRLAASKMRGAERRSFQAEMTLKYCVGSARIAERVFGWGRVNVEVGLAEHRTGIVCIGLQAAHSGTKRWEERYPEVAAALQQVAEAHAQQDPTFRTTIAYTRLTAQAAIDQLQAQGFGEEQLPAPSTMAVILNRMGYRLKPVVKAIPQKNCPKPTQSSTTSKPKIAKVTRAASND